MCVVLVRPCKTRCVWGWEEYKKEKERERSGRNKKENKKQEGGRVRKEKEREEEGRWTRAPAAAPRRRHLCQ